MRLIHIRIFPSGIIYKGNIMCECAKAKLYKVIIYYSMKLEEEEERKKKKKRLFQ